MTTELTLLLGGRHDVVNSALHVIDRRLIRLWGFFGGRLNHCLNAGSDNKQLSQQGLQSRSCSFIHWGFALGWGVGGVGGCWLLNGEALEQTGDHRCQLGQFALGLLFVQSAQLDRGGVISGLIGAVREVQFLGAEACGLVSHSQTGQIGFAGVGEVRPDFDAGEQLLALVIEPKQFLIRLELGLQRNLARLQIVSFFDESHGEDGAVGTAPAFVLAPDHSGVLGWCIGRGDIAQFLGKDFATINGRAAGGDTFPVRN
ncbi:hypothetical protein D9M71_570050 [compost metagenome]